MDLVGPFQESSDTGFKYILVVKCALTQYIILVPLLDKSSEEVTRAMVDHVFCTVGPVDVFVSDNGREFDNRTIAAVHFLINQQQRFTVPYVSRSNGLVENLNRTVKDMLSIYCSDNQRDWDTYLPVIGYQYNITINAATGFSPFRAVFGREAKQVSESWIEEFAESKQVNISQYVNRLTKTLLGTWESLGERVVKGQLRVDEPKPLVRVERLFRPYKVGDMFFLKVIPKRFLTVLGGKKQKLTAKLQYRYTGPHKVIEVLNPIVYIAMVDNKIKRVHALRMKRDPSTVKEYIPMAHNMFDDDAKDDTLLPEELLVEYEKRRDSHELLIEDEVENTGHFADFWDNNEVERESDEEELVEVVEVDDQE